MLVPELQAEPKLAYPHNVSFTTSDPEQNVSTTTKSELPTEPIQGEELMPKLTYTHNLVPEQNLTQPNQDLTPPKPEPTQPKLVVKLKPPKLLPSKKVYKKKPQKPSLDLTKFHRITDTFFSKSKNSECKISTPITDSNVNQAASEGAPPEQAGEISATSHKSVVVAAHRSAEVTSEVTSNHSSEFIIRDASHAPDLEGNQQRIIIFNKQQLGGKLPVPN